MLIRIIFGLSAAQRDLHPGGDTMGGYVPNGTTLFDILNCIRSIAKEEYRRERPALHTVMDTLRCETIYRGRSYFMSGHFLDRIE